MTTPASSAAEAAEPAEQPRDQAARTAAFGRQARDLAVRAGRTALDHAGQLARRASTPARTFVTALRGQGQAQGLRHLPQEGATIIAVNHRHPLDARALVAALPRTVLVVSTTDLESAVLARRAGIEPGRRRDVWQVALDELDAGGVVAVFPEGAPSPDSNLHKGRDAVGRLVLAAQVPVVPAVLDTRAALLELGPALKFRRFDDLPADRTLARGVTDEIMGAIADLGRLRYVDTYPTTARDQLRSATHKRRDQLRARAQARRLAEQQTIEARQVADLEERRDLARLHRVAQEQARARAEQAAERDRQRRATPAARPHDDGANDARPNVDDDAS